MARKKAGLYLGVNSVGAALTESKNLLFLSSENLSSSEAKEADISDENLHWQALVRKSFRQANVEGKEVCLSLADRDFIIRSLEMPLMKKSEIESALIYEVEKYIPFKPEELVWDYQYNRLSKEKKIRVSFVGIRKNNLARTRRFLESMGLKAESIEPACLSLARIIKSDKNAKSLKNFVLLDLTSKEAYLTFFQGDLPVFNRYLSIEEKEGRLDLDNFAEVVSFSFQYFQREFKETKLDKFFLVTSEAGSEGMAAILEKSLSLEVKVLTPNELTSRQQSSVESLKAFGAAVREKYPYKFNPTLEAVEIKEEDSVVEPMSFEVSWRWGLLSIVAGISLIFYFIATTVFENMLAYSERSFDRKENALLLPSGLQEVGWQNIDEAIGQKYKKIEKLKSFTKDRKELLSFLTALSQRAVLPPQAKFEDVRINFQQNGYQGEMRGYIYRGDDFQEREGVNDFIDNLRKNEAVRGLFSRVSLSSTSRGEVGGFSVTRFSIRLD